MKGGDNTRGTTIRYFHLAQLGHIKSPIPSPPLMWYHRGAGPEARWPERNCGTFDNNRMWLNCVSTAGIQVRLKVASDIGRQSTVDTAFPSRVSVVDFSLSTSDTPW